VDVKAQILTSLDQLKDDMAKTENSPSLKPCISDFSSKISQLEAESLVITRTLRVLEGLHFPGMELRRSQVANAHRETCRWVYDSKFKDWMNSTDPLFWVRLTSFKAK
jgi:hypothetical protein